MLFLVREIRRLLVDDVLEGEADLCILLVLGLALQQQLVQCFEVLGLLQIDLVCRPREMVRACAAEVELLQGAAEDLLDLPEFFGWSADVVLFLEWVTDLQIVYIVDVEVSVDLTVFTFRHYATELQELALLDSVFQLFELLREAGSNDQSLAIEL